MGPRWLIEKEDLWPGQLEVAVPEQDLGNEFKLTACITWENSMFIRAQRISTWDKLQSGSILLHKSQNLWKEYHGATK